MNGFSLQKQVLKEFRMSLDILQIFNMSVFLVEMGEHIGFNSLI
jgi:hypothetical protein